MTTEITQELLLSILRYEPDTGKLYWLERPVSLFTDGKQTANHSCRAWNGNFAGKEAFTSHNSDEAFIGSIFDRMYIAHRVSWFMEYGKWPLEVDHSDHCPNNNRFETLREVSHLENQRNRSMNSNNKSGVTGVRREKGRPNWSAIIGVKGKVIRLGKFKDINDAIAARKAAEIKYNFHENHGKRA